MSENTCVSVIMSCYNGQKFLSQAVESVINQTYTNWELLICDDCSTDDSAAIAKAYAEKDNRIKYLCMEKNSGSPAMPRNLGIENASGRFIAILDCDDIWMPEKLEKQVPLFENEKVGVVYSDYEVIDGDGNPVNKVIHAPKKTNFEKNLYGNGIGNLTGVFDTKKCGKVYHQKIGAEDYLFWQEILKTGVQAVNAGSVLAKYREANLSLSGNKARSAKWTWDIYRKSLKLPLVKCVWCFCFYAVKAVLKHI